ncbi:ATP-binding protein [uncultured Enterococcus sp.]|uniref:ATP-binding protein n=1 Tax=uncultured Enterococcus sp. TaxID=167972 RepID=UPI00258CEED2|nr:ATP-binding protein [uncultured Enterococcus sp.]
MAREVVVPTKFTKYALNEFLGNIISENLEPLDDTYIIDLTRLEFIDTGGVACLYNICMWLTEAASVVATFKISNINTTYKNKEAMRYLEDCGFFSHFFDEEHIFGLGNLRSTTLPIKLLKVSDSYQWNQLTLKSWLQNCTKRNAEFSNIQVGIEEIFNNIEDHSSKNIGCVFGQFFPRRKDNQICITISDFGRGIPTVMRETFGNHNDLHLLLKALEEGVSTKSTPRNRGAGLPNIMRSLTTARVGTVHILSNHAKVIIEDGKISKVFSLQNYYPGTFFEVSINVDNDKLYEGEEEEEFEW